MPVALSTSLRWLSLGGVVSALRRELGGAPLREARLTPHGIALLLALPEVPDAWIPLLEREQWRGPKVLHLHTMTAANAAAMLRARGASELTDGTWLQKERAEVLVCEWEDGSMTPWGGQAPAPAPGEQSAPWAIVASCPGEQPGTWSLEVITAEERDALRRAVTLMQEVPRIEELEELPWSTQAACGEAMHRLGVAGRLLPIIEPVASRCEALGDWADRWAFHGESREGPESRWVGAWGDHALLGDLEWSVLPGEERARWMTSWLQRTEERLKLNGFSWEITAHFKAPHEKGASPEAWQAACSRLQLWAESEKLLWKRAPLLEGERCIDPLGGPFLEWRVTDPLGATWPVAVLCDAVRAQGRWWKEWSRSYNRKQVAAPSSVEERARQLREYPWCAAVSAYDLLSEQWIKRAQDTWSAHALGRRKKR